ncbi:hypothetical protein [Bacillus sp. MRMR6]|uniref:hypothetical protein n=1 Tax=Bacillus sp. MRMR6 TaxID=1928617 RepID=UPI0009528894|nr:hypothetical protein [Bacillus sp. MRMR6]OLS33750.1 hypothetical protein BTR25_24290 [Bacillus sp. MRMR6]
MYTLLKTHTTEDFDSFVSYWESLYAYSPKHSDGNDLYFRNIMKDVFSTEDIKELFYWKNGMKLSGKKSMIVDDICKEINLINELKHSHLEYVTSSLPKFMNRDGVWQIFLLHILKPDYFPIFDQHTYRAYQYLQTGFIRKITELKDLNEFYQTTYLPFIHEKLINTATVEERIRKIGRMDRALFAFGKFLKSGYVKLLGPTIDFHLFRSLFSSVYARDKEQYSTDLVTYLKSNPEQQKVVGRLFQTRDVYMNNDHYQARWDMGYYLMESFKIEFEQSEGSELIFSLCCAIKAEFALTDYQVGGLFKEILEVQYV